MNNRQLLYFVEVYKRRSIKKAAEALFISQQGMSKMIINLEQECGTPLFERRGNSLVPTDYAEFLLPHAKKILEEYSCIESSSNYYRKLSVCTINGVTDGFPEDFFSSFYSRYPNINLEIIETSHESVIEHLTSDNCDVALLQIPYDFPGYVNEFVFSYGFCMGVNVAHPLAGKEEFLPEYWDGQLIAGKGFRYPIFRDWIKSLNDQSYFPRIMMESNNDRLLLSLAEQNVALACVTANAAKAYHSDKIRFLPVNAQETFDNIYLCYKKNRAGDSLNSFREFFKEKMGDQ